MRWKEQFIVKKAPGSVLFSSPTSKCVEANFCISYFLSLKRKHTNNCASTVYKLNEMMHTQCVIYMYKAIMVTPLFIILSTQ